MVARFLLFRRQSQVGMPQQPYWQARQFVSQKKSLSIIAWSACCTAVSKPSSRSLHTPSMVVPPGGAHRVHECDWVLGAVHSKRPAAHNCRGGDLLGDRSCKSRADTRLRQSVNVHQNKCARCPAESSECWKQVFIYMVHLADRREYRVGGFYMCARCRLAAAYRRYGGFLYLKSLNNEYKLDIQQ